MLTVRTDSKKLNLAAMLFPTKRKVERTFDFRAVDNTLELRVVTGKRKELIRWREGERPSWGALP